VISAKDFVDYLKKQNIDSYYGVPDSLLKELTSYIYENFDEDKNLIAANEGNAIAIAAGYNLSTGKVPVVYMQNSGLGNCLNPLTSLTNKEVYSFPMLLLIGWRGEANSSDEPQHILPGRVIEKQLELLEIPYLILSSDSDFKAIINKAIDLISHLQTPVAILVRKKTFGKYNVQQKHQPPIFSRKDAINCIISNCKASDLILSTTGKASRELYELRMERNESRKDFLSVGSMGHLSSIALGLSQGSKSKNIICIDGDGSCIMHMGALATLGSKKVNQIKYILLNNGAHDSVGGQSTVGFKVDFIKIAEGCGFDSVYKCQSNHALIEIINSKDFKEKNIFIEVVIDIEKRDNLPRPSASPIENKNDFLRHLKS